MPHHEIDIAKTTVAEWRNAFGWMNSNPAGYISI